MPERVGAPLFLLARFAEYFDEVVAIKLAIADGRLGAMLAVGDEPTPTEPADLAARTSARLAMTLLAQRNEIARTGTAREMDAYEQALYVMTALTDELFILETDWSGSDAWMDTLVEHRIFRSRNAGVRVFEMAEALLAEPAVDRLQADVAAVMVLALRLGFQGCYRGEHGEPELRRVRARLYRLVQREHDGGLQLPTFPQAGEQTQAGGTPARLAPLTPWYIGAAIALIVYLVLSSAVWLVLIEPFRQAVGTH
ncbi:DotU family type IV/VI secretion system protein [Lysobacter brunescens]|uniref:DotU family type IV/VI secretion system protein n=1 Tax=Lysobacter brunescens TaxID=262323 RepID=A0ABW2YHM6_9GAMM